MNLNPEDFETKVCTKCPASPKDIPPYQASHLRSSTHFASSDNLNLMLQAGQSGRHSPNPGPDSATALS